MLSFKPNFSLSFSFIKRLFSFSSLSAMRVVSSAYLRLLIFLPAILSPASTSSSPVFQIANIHWIIEKARELKKKKKRKKQENSRKTSTSASLTMLKHLTVWIMVKLWKILKEMGIPDHLTCLLRNLYAGQEGTVRTGHGTTDWFQIGKGVR